VRKWYTTLGERGKYRPSTELAKKMCNNNLNALPGILPGNITKPQPRQPNNAIQNRTHGRCCESFVNSQLTLIICPIVNSLNYRLTIYQILASMLYYWMPPFRGEPPHTWNINVWRVTYIPYTTFTYLYVYITCKFKQYIIQTHIYIYIFVLCIYILSCLCILTDAQLVNWCLDLYVFHV